MYLKEFREKLNLTQNELSSILDIAQTTIARYENDKVKPTSTVLLKYINELNANPNFLFLGIEPHLLNNLPKLDSSNMDLLNDITLMMSQEHLREKLNKILIDEIIQRFEKQNDSLVAKLLEIVKMDDPVKTRPFLFLYYIFQLIEKDFTDTPKEISDYKQYLGDVITNYKVVTWKNQPLFTEKIKSEIRDFLDVKLTTKECELLVKNYKNTLEMLEQKMPPSMIKYHRNSFK
ncbi:transcriptional regulator, XRE family [Sulfurimonas denitrificans DSM 1251]|jgi:transcriptional regulator with XRE-family HTH domain|uniref:Transcriptional regulator, XRE family n=1 Tax=Sulfurimonas denitrificans (strain ATCC 33889 / DSM 1251) TaxID=326298 RepID=Q30RZ8_SULDN|nr:helix-turn-helix domain-containing protein [Sulfurimonas denitrificans]ABB44233.1 transcriptional regulator, XRE family [Sulfurimonas denitrificans DSM 1251]